MNTAHYSIQALAQICHNKGIRRVVFSPGSRSAPLVMAFSFIESIERFIIPDERAAGYFALGMAQQTGETVAVICTSGTAVLNLLPATCEAFYQEIPLCIITADRPFGAEARGENQAINQQRIFTNYTVADVELDADNDSPGALAQKADTVLAMAQQHKRPVHINLHIDEPVYKLTDEACNFTSPGSSIQAQAGDTNLPETAMQQLLLQLSNVPKKLVVVGAHFYNTEFITRIAAIANRPDTAVLAETTSNAQAPGVINNYDTCLRLLAENELPAFVPDVVITFGNQIISKEIKKLLTGRNIPHWDVAQFGGSRNRDYFKNNRPQPPHLHENAALYCLANTPVVAHSTYNNQWQQQWAKAHSTTRAYAGSISFSDFKVFSLLAASYPKGANIQYGNSSPVRYSNFFAHPPGVTVNANRGTSGIDGCVSTAAGAACVNHRLTINIVGDVSFFYDSNGLWNNYLSANLRLIVINNSGGTIFRMILDEPTIGAIKEFERFFETRHQLTAQHLAGMYGLPYYFCDTEAALNKTLETFYGPQNGKAAILEIKTDGELSADLYKQFISQLKHNNQI